MKNKKQSRGEILYIGDEPTVQAPLESQGYTFHSLTSGRESLAFVRTACPDLVLVEIGLPEINGFEVLGDFNAARELCSIPIILVSERYDDPEKARGFAMGAMDYITKPFDFSDLCARIELHLKYKLEIQDLIARLEEHDSFIHTLGHDIRGPLGITMGYAALLEEDDSFTEDERQQLVHEIRNSAERTYAMFDRLLLIHHLDTLNIALVPVNMTQLVANAQHRLAPQIEKSQATIIVPDAWPTAIGHESRLEEVWTTLIGNAIKYGSVPPQVELGSTLHDRYVEFWIRRDSSGLSEEELARLFPPVTRQNDWSDQAIVHKIIAKLNGTIGVRSVPGDNTTFYFTLPNA